MFPPGTVSGHHHGKSCPLKGFLTSRWLTSLQAGATGNFLTLQPHYAKFLEGIQNSGHGVKLSRIKKEKRLKREIKKQTTPLPQSSLPPPPPPPPYSTNKNKPKKKKNKPKTPLFSSSVSALHVEGLVGFSAGPPLVWLDPLLCMTQKSRSP